jgi:ABC-type transport system substrate-binding protein
MVNPSRPPSRPILGTLFLVAILVSLANTQPGLVNVQALWTYPSGYDPHGGYVDRLIFIVYPSEDFVQARLDLQAGSVYSFDDRLPYEVIVELEANPDIEVSSALGTTYRQFTMNCQRFPTNLTGYRVAFAHALDKHLVAETGPRWDFRGSFAQVMDNPIPLAFEFWSYEDQMSSHFYTEDIVNANATLDSAHIIDTPDSPHPGWRYYDADMSGNWTLGDKRGDTWAPDGLKLELWVQASYTPGSDFFASGSQAGSLEKCGLQAELVEVDFNRLISGLESGEYNIGCFKWNIHSPGDPTLLYDFFHTKGEQNGFFYRYNNSEYDHNCTMFMNAPTRLEARNWAWNCCRILMKEMPMIVCFNDEYTHAYRTDLWEGYVPQVGVNRMGGNPYTYQQIRRNEDAGGPFGCIPTDYVTVLSEVMDYTNTILTSSEYTQTIFNLIYSKLWRVDPLDPMTAPAPDLAYEWVLEPTTASGDIQEGMKYTFYLYENITWHDGSHFTSEDVQYSLMTIHPQGTYTWENVASIYRVDTPDDYTVEIYSNATGYVTFTKATSVQILPKHIWRPYETSNFTWTPEGPTHLTGTGCYQWVSRVAGQYILLDRYADWHFSVTHPDRPPCPGPVDGPWPPIGSLFVIIAIQVVILVVLLNRRRARQNAFAKNENSQSKN